MKDVPNTENFPAFAEAMLRLQRLTADLPGSQHWRWILFDQDLKSGIKAVNGSVGPVVSQGLPWLSAACSLRWLGSRLFFWPQGIPRRRRISIVSSRLKQRLDEESWWFDLLRTATLRSDPTHDVLCAVAGTAAHQFVCRAAELFGRSLLEFRSDATEQTVDEAEIAAWLAETARSKAWNSTATITETDLIAEPPVIEGYASGTHWSVFVSPAMTMLNNSKKSDAMTFELSHLRQLPIADRILFAAGDRLKVLRTRHGGVIQALLMQHVQDSERRDSLVMLASDAAGQLPAIALESHGCVIPWLLKSSGDDVSHDISLPDPGNKDCESSTAQDSWAASTPLSRPEDWLLHWTRSTVGPWPDQDEQEFNDELILGCRSSDRSALATLLRIVIEGRLWASSDAIRGGFRVVSFTEVPLHEFRRRRVYRKHRRRYDFELWGIAIRRDILTSAGVRPVEYGDEGIWQTMTAGARPFFQNVGAGDGWTKDEREWRIADHVNLNKLPASAVVVFVDSGESRAMVEKQTRWPVIVVPD
ncbi:MAG: hypothetical protein WKF77_30630 [Planctomycetaceae bacterium]